MVLPPRHSWPAARPFQNRRCGRAYGLVGRQEYAQAPARWDASEWRLTDNQRLQRTDPDAIEVSFLAGFIATPVIKRFLGRSRPLRDQGAYHFEPFSKDQSFPSGHATNAFAVGSVIGARSDGWLAPTIAYSLATGVAVSRVNDNKHSVSDGVTGAGIGRAVVRLRERSPPRRVLIVPSLDSGGRVSLMVHVRLTP